MDTDCVLDLAVFEVLKKNDAEKRWDILSICCACDALIGLKISKLDDGRNILCLTEQSILCPFSQFEEVTLNDVQEHVVRPV